MRRTAIKPARIHELAKEFLDSKHNYLDRSKGGRPRTFDDILILTLICIQNLHQFSFRETIEFSEDYFKELPELSTYHYRVKILPVELIQEVIEYIAEKIKESDKNRHVRFLIMDGTGFSYHDVYPMKYYRGMEIRKIQAHVKAGALIGILNKRRFVLSARAGPPYTGDVRLIEPLVEKANYPKSYFLGDKGFDCIRLIELILSKKCKPVIDIKSGRLNQIKDPLRILSKHNVEALGIYKKRPLIEGLFGNLKQKLSSHVRIFNVDIAQKFALIRFALLNMAVLASLEKADQLWLWFSNSLLKPLTAVYLFKIPPFAR